jgi:hypothetical protein
MTARQLRDPRQDWLVRLRLAIDADDADRAREIAEQVLHKMDVSAAGEPQVTRSAGRAQYWNVVIAVNMSGLRPITPDDASTCFRYVTRNLTGVRFTGPAADSRRSGLWEWLPDSWQLAGQQQELAHPAVRAAGIQILAGQGRALSGPGKRRLAELTERLRVAGAADPEGWALSEIHEDIAQVTRFLFLRGVWRRMHSCADEALASELAGTLRRDGAREKDLREFVQVALGRLAFDLLYFLDEPDGTFWDTAPERDVADDDRRWLLAEVEPDGRLTGRDAGDLHESWSDTDPSGHEGAGWAG